MQDILPCLSGRICLLGLRGSGVGPNSCRVPFISHCTDRADTFHMTNTPSTETSLHRGLGRRQIEFIAIGGCIGTGLFMGSGRTISVAGPSIIFLYAITGLMLYFVMRAMGELLMHDLNYKSFVDFSEDILGPWAGFVMGWSYWFAWIVAAIAEIIAITGYTAFWWPELSPWIPAVITILFLLVINLMTVKTFGELEFWLAIVKVAAIVGLIGIGIWLILTGFTSPKGEKALVSNLWSYGGMFPHGIQGMLAGLQMTIFAFAGMEIIGTMMAEAKKPEEMIPAAINKIPFRILLFYIGTVTVLMMVTPWVNISATNSPFVGMFSLIGFASAATIVNVVVLSSATSSSNSGVFATSRMIYGLAVLHNAPAVFGRLSLRRVPVAGILLAIFLMTFVTLILTSTESMMQAFQIVGAVSALLFVFVWTLILVSYLVYRQRRPEAHDTSVFKMPLSGFMPYVVLAFFVVVIYAVSLDITTRTALYILPCWFLALGLLFLVKTFGNADHANTKKIFLDKVNQEKRDAKAYRTR